MTTMTEVDRDTYYDLIELPSGRHVPVPIAEEIIGTKSLGKIPVSRKKVRDNEFFSCPTCGAKDFYASIRYCCVEDEEIEEREEKEEEERQLKEKALTMMVKKAQFYKLRYIKAVMQ